MIIDGLNQRPTTDWGRVVDRTSEFLEEIGGRLVVTSRTAFFKERLRFMGPSDELHVEEWTDSERDSILMEAGVDPTTVTPTVGVSLRNPRLLGIALDLLDEAGIAGLEQLSPSRLLFEHLQRCSVFPITPAELAQQLREHAKRILARLGTEHDDAPHVFEAAMASVADGRFFQEIPGDPTRYSLREDGLTLALALAIVDKLRTSGRQDRDLDEDLAALLEPIAFLDDVADVLLAALTIESGVADSDLVGVLAYGFGTLQNVTDGAFAEFKGLVASEPAGFMQAAERIALADDHHINLDWFEEALLAASHERMPGQR